MSCIRNWDKQRAVLCASPSHHGQVRDSPPAPFQEDLTTQHPLQDTQRVLSAGFPSLLLPSLSLIPKPSSQNTVLYSSCFPKALLRSFLRSALLCHEMLHPKQRQCRERRGITPGTTVAVRAGTAAGKAVEARVCLHQLPLFGDRRQTGADKQKKTKILSSLWACNSNNTDGHSLPKS